MKPLAAFAMGLWTGAVVVGVVAMWRFHEGPYSKTEVRAAMAAELQDKETEIRRLQQEQARLAAETQRLKETLAELKVAQRAPAARRLEPPSGRTRPAVTAAPPASAESAALRAFEDAVIKRDATALTRLESLALKNDDAALEALALLADTDEAATLTRVWSAGTLNSTNFLKATRFLGATAEANPHLEPILRQLAAEGTGDQRMWRAVVDGLADPSLPSRLGGVSLGRSTPRSKTDLELRLRLLDVVRGVVADEPVQQYADRARAELQDRSGRTPAATE